MRPSIWKNNKLVTHDGNAFVSLAGTASGQVVVGNEPFLLDGISSSNFCLISMATSSQTPTVPADFSSYSAYITWVRTNQNVCGRNLRVLSSYPHRDYEQLDEFSNPEAEGVPTLFKVTIHGTLPANSTFGLTCAPLNINTSWNVNDGNVRTASAITPAHFEGNVTTFATLSSGSWPSGVWIETVVYVGEGERSPAARYAETEWACLGGRVPKSLDANKPHLVMLGNTATKFVTHS